MVGGWWWKTERHLRKDRELIQIRVRPNGHPDNALARLPYKKQQQQKKDSFLGLGVPVNSACLPQIQNLTGCLQCCPSWAYENVMSSWLRLSAWDGLIPEKQILISKGVFLPCSFVFHSRIFIRHGLPHFLICFPGLCHSIASPLNYLIDWLRAAMRQIWQVCG